jgi:membrane associated rhomboid family serine protease
MVEEGVIGIILILANFLVSYKGFTDDSFFERYKFEVDKVLVNKEYWRLISSGFLHVNWIHLIFNMLSLGAFSGSLESHLGMSGFALVYFASLIGGDLLALLVHRQHGDYSAVGASGAVCGVIFATIALFPNDDIGFIGIPFFLPSWLYGILFVAFSIYGIKSQKGNIGHEAHLGGALIGLLLAVVLYPSALAENYWIILIIALPTLLFVYLIITKPSVLLLNSGFFKPEKKYHDIDHKYKEEKIGKQQELDRLLEKIKRNGMNSLSAKEKARLEELSR